MAVGPNNAMNAAGVPGQPEARADHENQYCEHQLGRSRTTSGLTDAARLHITALPARHRQIAGKIRTSVIQG